MSKQHVMVLCTEKNQHTFHGIEERTGSRKFECTIAGTSDLTNRRNVPFV